MKTTTSQRTILFCGDSKGNDWIFNVDKYKDALFRLMTIERGQSSNWV